MKEVLLLIPHNAKLEEVTVALSCDPTQGLSKEEAQNRLSQYGQNKLKEKKRIIK